jgi:PAS domain S-box-containing protein
MATDNTSSPSSWEMGPDLSSFLESSNEAVFIFKIATDPDAMDTLAFVNNQACELFGYSRDELFHLDIFSLSCGEPFHNQLMLKEERNKLATGGPQSYEWHAKAKDGRLFWAEISVQHFLLGSRNCVLARVRDITEGRKLQEQLMVSDRMASVGTLAAGVAHEINNPLAAIMANIELVAAKFTKLASRMPDEEVHEIRDDLGDALDAAIRLKNIVNDLRIFSRAQEVRDGPIDIGPLLESSLRMAYNEIRHRAKVVRDFQPLPPVNGNESRLGQVFLNIIVNAAQAIEEGHADANEIRVTTRLDEKGMVVIEISDTGVGIPPEMIQKLFTPFFTTKPAGVGTGLGLVICHRIVDALGGSIEVASAVGKGSTFRIMLPPGQEDYAPSMRVWDEHIAAPFHGNILIIDDEYMLGRVLGRTLDGEHQVTVVTRAQDALKKISAGERFDAILCDLMMPEMSGMEFYHEVSQVVSDQARQIIFMTGGAFTPGARAFLDEVPNARLQKPFELTTLKNLINLQLSEVSSHSLQPGV